MKLRDFLRSGTITLALVAGLCLIAKVWIIRHFFSKSVEVTELIFPLILLAVYEGLHTNLQRKRETKPISDFWDHPLLWSILIIISTAVSTWLYVK